MTRSVVGTTVSVCVLGALLLLSGLVHPICQELADFHKARMCAPNLFLLPQNPVAVPPRVLSAKNRMHDEIQNIYLSRGRLFFRSLRAKMEIAGQMALKTAYHETGTLNNFNVNSILALKNPWRTATLHKQEKTWNLPASRAILDRGIAHVWKIGGGLLQS